MVLRKVHASLTVPMRGSAGTGLSEKEEKTHEYENVGTPSFVGKRVKLSSAKALNRVTELLFCPVKQFVIGGISAQYPRLIAFFPYRYHFAVSIFITRLTGHFF